MPCQANASNKLSRVLLAGWLLVVCFFASLSPHFIATSCGKHVSEVARFGKLASLLFICLALLSADYYLRARVSLIWVNILSSRDKLNLLALNTSMDMDATRWRSDFLTEHTPTHVLLVQALRRVSLAS